MALIDRLNDLERTASDQPRCSFGQWQSSQDTMTRELLDRLLASKVGSNSIAVELAAEGHRFARDTISDHRRNRCRCATGKSSK